MFEVIGRILTVKAALIIYGSLGMIRYPPLPLAPPRAAAADRSAVRARAVRARARARRDLWNARLDM